MNDYLLTIQIPITGRDDVDARVNARKFTENSIEVEWIDGAVGKLQRIHKNEPPQKLKFSIPAKVKVVHCKKEPYDVYIGRGKCPKTGELGHWGNPFSIGEDGNRDDVICKYSDWLTDQPKLMKLAKKELAGKVLGCWCHPEKCHGDILAVIVDGCRCTGVSHRDSCPFWVMPF